MFNKSHNNENELLKSNKRKRGIGLFEMKCTDANEILVSKEGK